METVLITGGTGMVGKELTKMLTANGYAVIILTRRLPAAKTASPNSSYALWDVHQKQVDRVALAKADHIIHLAGAGVMDKKWTDAYKQEIIDSRVKSAALLIDTLRLLPHKVRTFISASAIGYYGEDGPGQIPFEENAPADTAFLGEVCRLWEESVEPVKELGARLVKYRIGIVLGKDEGALKEFITPLQFGVATVLGNGRQAISWIALEDLCRLFVYAIENNTVQGVYNAVAPAPVSNRTLVTTLAKLRNGKGFLRLPVPAFLLKLVMGGRSIEILKSATVSDKKITAAGFQFHFPTIETALKHILGKD